MRLSAAVLIISLLALSLLTFTARAQLSGPSTLQIEDVQVFRHMAEADDILYIIRYNIDWGNETQPLQSVVQTFSFLLYDDAGAVVGNSTACPFHNEGYNQGIVSFYFPGNTTNPSWGELGNVTITGTGLFAAPPPSITYELTAEDYSSYTSPVDIREELRQFIIAQASFLDFSWNDYWIGIGSQGREVDLLQYLQDSRTYVLSTTGEAYLLQAIPDLDIYCPRLFLVTLSPLEYDEKDHSQAATSEYQDQFAGTPIEDFKDAISGWMGNIGVTTAFSILTVLFVAANMAFAGNKWNTIYPGLQASLGPVLIMGRMGFPDLALIFLSAAFVIIAAFFLLLLRPSQG